VAREWIVDRVSRDPRFANLDAVIEREGFLDGMIGFGDVKM
jgi:hypothetical protein